MILFNTGYEEELTEFDIRYSSWYRVINISQFPQDPPKETEIIINVSKIITESSIWIDENFNNNDVVFNIFNHSYYFRNEEDFMGFKLRWQD